MYYPYLRGKQAELGALQELVLTDRLSSEIIPVIEPVKLSAYLVKFMRIFCERDRVFYLAIPPKVGEFYRQLHADYTISEQDDETQIKKKKMMQRYKDEYHQLIQRSNVRIATFASDVSSTMVTQLDSQGKNEQCIILFRNEGELINYYATVDQCKWKKPIYFVPLNNFEFSNNARLVLFNDKFVIRKNNAEYLDYPEEFYSRDHLIFKKDGYIGFADYSIVGDKYQEGGSQPKVQVIHIVYPKEPNNEYYIKHFCSDSNVTQKNQNIKFFEAARKVKEWNNRNPQMDTQGIKDIIDYYDRGHYPGLTIEKKMSFKNHFEFVSRYLDNV